MKKIQFTPEQLANDPSLKYCPYRYGELVWSDQHKAWVRFGHYEGRNVHVLSYAGMAPLSGVVPDLQIRRG